MRQNVIIALLAVCATLLAINLVASFSRPTLVVEGQAGGSSAGDFVLATSQITQNEPVVFILNTKTNKLTCYGTKNKGIDFKGVRDITYDLKPREFPKSQRYSVAEMKKETDKLQKSGEE